MVDWTAEPMAVNSASSKVVTKVAQKVELRVGSKVRWWAELSAKQMVE